MQTKSNLPTNTSLAEANESLRFELERCQREREEYRRLLEHAERLFAEVADAIFVATSEGAIVDANPAACVLLGYSKAELLALHPWDFVTSALREDILGLLAKLESKTPVTVQRTYRRRNGEQLEMDLRMNRCTLAGRCMIIVSCHDVTMQKRLEDRLRRSESNLAEGQRLTKTGSWILDYHTGNTDWSVETCRIFGFPDPPPSPHYREFRARVRREDRDGVDRGLRESFETGEPRPLKYVFILADGVRKNIETISQPVRDESGKVVKLMGTVMDVTERVKAQEALQKSEDHLRLVIDTIPGLVWSAKPDGSIEYLNQRWIEYTGLKLEQAAGWGWRDAIYPDDLPGLEAYWRSLLAEGKAGETEARLRRFDGEFRWFLFRGFPLHDGTGKLVQWYGTNMDIDNRKWAEEQLRAAEKLARGQVDALKSALDAMAAESTPDRLVEHILHTLTEQFGAHSSSVWRRDEAKGLIGFEFAFEEGGVVTKEDRRFAGMDLWLPMDDFWPWPEVFRTGRASVIEDIRTVRSFALRDRLLALGVVTVLLIPMSVAGRLEGAIGLRFTEKRGFRSEEIELAQALANQAMLAMTLTRLSAENRESAVIAERNRMARDIHDTLAQGFTGVIMQLEAAKGAIAGRDTSSVPAHIERAEALARASLGEARRSVRAMRSPSLLDGTLSTALDDLLKRMTSGAELQAELAVQGEGRPLPPEWEEGLLRIAQESLTNTIKHAGARHFRAELNFSADTVRLQLLDDGRGFDPQAGHEGFGLIGMRERAEQMAGIFVLRSKPGNGTEIVVELNQSNAAGSSHENRQA